MLHHHSSLTVWYVSVQWRHIKCDQNIFINSSPFQEAVSLNYIQESTAAFLDNQFPKVPVMYILPKIHKPGFALAGRPIVLGCGGVLQPVAQFLDSFLQPFVFQMHSYIKNTKHLIQLLEGIRKAHVMCSGTPTTSASSRNSSTSPSSRG